MYYDYYFSFLFFLLWPLNITLYVCTINVVRIESVLKGHLAIKLRRWEHLSIPHLSLTYENGIKILSKFSSEPVPLFLLVICHHYDYRELA